MHFQLKRHSYILSLVLLLISLISFSGVALAQDGGSPQVHTVQKGETLFSIAQKYDITVQQIKDWNNLTSNALEVGQQLKIKSQKSSANTIIHTVSKGETLYAISKKYGVSLSSLRNWNDLQKDALSVGQKLTIHTTNKPQISDQQKQKMAEASDSTSSLIVEQDASAPTTYYTVKSGDNLYNIARDYQMSVSQLKALNDLKGNTIRVGQKLTVRKPRSDVNVVESETSAAAVQGNFRVITIQQTRKPHDLLAEFAMDSTEFASLNPRVAWNMPLIKGDKVTVLTPAKTKASNPYKLESGVDNLGSTEVLVYDSKAKATPTTSGELYNPNAMTAAHATIALGSVIYVENPQTHRGAYLLINDRISNNGLKVSQQAYQLLGYNFSGTQTGSANIFKRK
jgi:LysM repeat protein